MYPNLVHMRPHWMVSGTQQTTGPSSKDKQELKKKLTKSDDSFSKAPKESHLLVMRDPS